MEYSYPLRTDWATDEIISVIAFYEVIEKAYEAGTERDEIMNAYREFKKVVPSKAEEKTLLKEFEEASGYSSYHIVKSAENVASGEKVNGTLK
ncbi:UPF0223 family protein [Sporosarcina sp. 6E9]|uniref:UPF0223 family protein n=1 Tax=Sporosarcina sp. 6E9 TaxID=2819235 RepID=UPI001B300969|nr:UPF0223 family protein [Sporosarcina sp. 6E9]